MSEPAPSEQLLKQRIRENIIDYLELAASSEEQREYERSVPIAHVPNEVINQWAVWVEGTNLDWHGPPVFSAAENCAIWAFHRIWESVVADTRDPLPRTVDALIGSEPWERLAIAARNALLVFRERGRFSRDQEEPLQRLQGSGVGPT